MPPPNQPGKIVRSCVFRCSQAIRNVLSRMGHEVEIGSTVAAASETVREQEFDVILSDIGPPDGTGIDFMRTEGPHPATELPEYA